MQTPGKDPAGNKTFFYKDFSLAEKTSAAIIYIKAYQNFQLWVNGKKIETGVSADANWKRSVPVDVSGHIREGDNNITVMAAAGHGHPVLWLMSKGLSDEIVTDNSWRCSINNSPSVPVEIADDTKAHPIRLAFEPVSSSITRKAGFIILSFIAVICLCSLYSRLAACNQATLKYLPHNPLSVLFVVTLVWGVLFLNNLLRLSLDLGFDARFHIEYIDYIIDNGSLPLATEGWEMYQPPLFYFIAAVLFNFSSLFFSLDDASLFIKIIPFLCGIGQIYLTYLSSRLIFPDNIHKQTLAVAISAFIPMNIYISHYISNESLSAFFMSLSLYYSLKILKEGFKGNFQAVCLGTILGLGLLTKFTIILIIPVIFAAVFFSISSDVINFSANRLIKVFACLVLSSLLVSGWFYIRNYIYMDKFIIGNWDRAAGFQWWQDPGFHTFKYYAWFGSVFSNPYFSGFYSFMDAIYSTFWGDGFLGGTISFEERPRWSYDYMNIAYILAIPLNIAFLAGACQLLKDAMKSKNKDWILMILPFFTVGFGIIFMTLKLPYYAQAKAFYGLTLMMPFSILSAGGLCRIGRWLSGSDLKFMRYILSGCVGTFFLTVFLSFFIR